MIDLHMHTKYSDGQFEVKELLNILNEKGIKYASITDHNSIGAHIEMRDNNLHDLYEGEMITGVEIQTLVDDYLIEVYLNSYLDNDSLISALNRDIEDYHMLFNNYKNKMINNNNLDKDS